MRINMMLGGFLVFGGMCMAALSCNSDPIASNEIKRCTKVYILVEDAAKREYQRFVPQAQDWAYYVTEYGFDHGSTEHVYRYDHNIFINRRKREVEHKIVSEANYIASCMRDRKRTDTIYLMIDNGKTYSEYLVKERYDLKTDQEAVTIHNIYGDSELLVDYSMQQGQSTSTDTTQNRLAVRKVSAFNCHLIQQVTRFNGLDSINESFIRGIGSMHRRAANMDIRLKLINDMTVEAYLAQGCE